MQLRMIQARPAAWMMYLSALAHFVAPVLSGVSVWSLLLVSGGVGWVLAGLSLIRNRGRRLATLLFILALIGALIGLDISLGTWPVRPEIGLAITLCDLGAALLLFGVLWRAAPGEEWRAAPGKQKT